MMYVKPISDGKMIVRRNSHCRSQINFKQPTNCIVFDGDDANSTKGEHFRRGKGASSVSVVIKNIQMHKFTCRKSCS